MSGNELGGTGGDPTIDLCRSTKKIEWRPTLIQSGLQLANLDAIFNFLGHTGGFVRYATFGQFQFVDLSEGVGGYTQYIQFRRPDAFGYGKENVTNPWNEQMIDVTRFQRFPREKFAQTVRETEVEGVDLVVGDLNADNVRDSLYLLGERGAVVFRLPESFDPKLLQQIANKFETFEVIQILSSVDLYAVGLNFGVPGGKKITIPKNYELGDLFDYQKALILWNLPERNC